MKKISFLTKENIPKSVSIVASAVCVVSFIFSLAASIILLVNTIAIERLESESRIQIDEIINKIEYVEKSEEAKDLVREADRLYRSAYFTSVSFGNRGKIVLLISMLIFFASMRIALLNKKNLPPIFSSSKDIFPPLSAIFTSLILTVFLFSIVVNISHKQISSPVGLKEYSDEEIDRNWSSFRGPFTTGKAIHNNTPIRWDGESGENILFKSTIHYKGFSSPVIWNDKLFLTGDNTDKRAIICYDANNGSVLWTYEIDNPQTEIPSTTEDTGLAAPTPATDGTLLYAIFGTGQLVCIDFNGKVVWKRFMGVPENHYGHSSSLVVKNGILYVLYAHSSSSFLYGIKAENGKDKFKIELKSSILWSSPVYASKGEKDYIIINGVPLSVHNADTGQILYETNAIWGEIGPSAAYENGVAVCANEYAKAYAFNIETGEFLWEVLYDLPEASSPVIYNSLLFMNNSYGNLGVYNITNGALITNITLDTYTFSSPIVSSGKIYLNDNYGKTFVLTADKELTLLSENSIGENASSTPAIISNRIYIRGEEHLFCIEEN